MAEEPSATPEQLTKRLSAASRQVHTVSDALVNSRLVALFTDRRLYAAALYVFYCVFSALEAALEAALAAGDPDVSRFRKPLQGGLARAPGFAADLAYFLGPDWRAHMPAKSPALGEYERHLERLAKEAPRLLIAHSYTQHLAAASGGQIIRRLARKHLRLPEDQGTAAFEYAGDSSNTLRSQLKSSLDEWGAGLPETAVQQLLAEHVTAFSYNNRIIRAFPIPWTAVLRGWLALLMRGSAIGLGVVALLLAVAAAAVATAAAPWLRAAVQAIAGNTTAV